jgi:ATP-dependent DNA helicase Rep
MPASASCPCSRRAFEQGFAPRVQARQLAPLLEFCEFINRLQARAAREPAAQVMPDLLRAIAYEDWLLEHDEARAARIKLTNVQDFCDWLGKKGDEEQKTLIDLTQTIALINMLDKQDADIDAVQLSTLHAAKGLEFKHVFLIGIEEGVLPHREAEADNRIEEERRLMYVGITRAQRSLHLSYAEKRKQGRELIPCRASRFIDEMGREDLRFSGGKNDSVPDKAAGADRLAALKAMLAKPK